MVTTSAFLVLLCLLLGVTQGLPFYCSAYCMYEGDQPQCFNIDQRGCTTCDGTTFVESWVSSGCEVNSEAFGISGEFKEGSTIGISTPGFFPSWHQPQAISTYNYQVFGPWIRDLSGWSINFTSMGTDHFMVRVKAALYQTADYRGTFQVSFVEKKFNFTYGPLLPLKNYTLNEQGNEWGFLKESDDVSHEYSIASPNSYLILNLTQKGNSNGTIAVRELLIITKKCSMGCEWCTSSADICGSCIPGLELYGGRCVPLVMVGVGCASNEFYDAGAATPGCAPCPTACSSCYGNTNVGTNYTECTACQADGATSYYKVGGADTCSQSCPNGQFISGTTAFTCNYCDASCSTCENTTTTCTTCSSGYVYVSGTSGACVTNCGSGKYKGATSCDSCDTKCATCFGVSASECTSCTSGNYLGFGSTTCYASACPNGQFITDLKCVMCDRSCVTCSTDIFTCDSCNTGYVFSSSTQPGPCVQSCPIGQYFGPSACTNCISGCKTCFGGSTDSSGFGLECYACSSGYYLSFGSTHCTTTCPDGQVAGSDSNCLLCDTSCANCTVLPSTCTTCKSGYIFSGATPGPCINSCPIGTYAGSPNCTACPTGCSQCFGGATDGSGNGIQCTVCTGSFYLAIGSTICIGTCPDGQTAGGNNNCVFCDQSCSTCSGSATNCLSCKSGYIFASSSPGVCISSCPLGQYMGATACTLCPTGCKTCYGGAVDNNGNGAECMICNGSYYLAMTSTTCLTVCPNGQIPGLNNNCVACDISCSTCSLAITNCTACKTGYIFDSGTVGPCVSVCPIGEYSSGVACEPCATGCKQCFGPYAYTCTSCLTVGSTPYFLGINSHTCYTTCPDGQYSDPILSPDVCLLCSSACTRCNVVASNCTFCSYIGVSVVYRLNYVCYLTCPFGYYGLVSVVPSLDNTCEVCTTGCSSCFGSGLSKCNSCTTVTGNNYYLGVNSTICHPTTCPNGQYTDDINSPNVCASCHFSCARCSGTSTNCTFCTQYGLDLLYLLNNVCYRTCPDGYYAMNASSSTLSNTCQQCTPGCTKCTNSGLNKCSECGNDLSSVPYYLAVNSTTCGTTCPNGQFFNSAIMPFMCISCDINCARCSGISTNCTFCWYINSITPVYLTNVTSTLAKCATVCPNGYWPYLSPVSSVSHECKLCFDGCLTCTGGTNDTCTACTTNSVGTVYYKWSNQTICDTVCPSGQYINPTINFVCQVCNPACVTCNSLVFCHSCVIPYFFDVQLSTCVSVCKSNYYGNTTSNTQYICSQCTAGCLECTNTGLLSCQSCQNASGIVYYKRYNATECTTICPTGSYGVDADNACYLCDTGCVNCSINSTNCYACTTVNGVPYYKHLTLNKCVSDCPDGTYNNQTINQCQACIYYTYQSRCVLTCPSNTRAILVPVPICEDCNGTCNQNTSYSFTVRTALSDNGNSLVNTVVLPVPLAKNITLTKNSNVSIYLYKESRRRLLAEIIMLNLEDLIVSPDGQSIQLKTNVPTVSNLSSYTIKIDFASGLLVSQDGVPFDSTTNTFSLSEPTFMSTFYVYREWNYYVWAPGIIFIVIGLAMMCGSYWDAKVQNEWLYYIMFLQVVGLLRYARYPISSAVFNVLRGFAICEFLYVPNYFEYIFPITYKENSYDIVSFINTNHNFLINFGSELLIFLALQLPIVVLAMWKREAIYPTLRKVEEVLITLFFCRTFMACVLSLIGLGLNFDMISNTLFIISQVVGVVTLLLYAGYFLFHVRVVRELQLYKFNIALLIIIIPFIHKLYYPCVFFINLLEVIFFILDFCYYRDEKINVLNYVFQRVFIVFAYNIVILVESQTAFLICMCLLAATLFGMKCVLFYQAYKLNNRPEIEPEEVKEFGAKEQLPMPPDHDGIPESEHSAAQIINLDEVVHQPEIIEEPVAPEIPQMQESENPDELKSQFHDELVIYFDYDHELEERAERNKQLKLEKQQKKASGMASAAKTAMNSTGGFDNKIMGSTEVNFFKPSMLKESKKESTPPKRNDDIEEIDIDDPNMSPEKRQILTKKQEVGFTYIEPAPKKQIGLRFEDSDSEDNNSELERKREEKRRKRIQMKGAKLNRKYQPRVPTPDPTPTLPAQSDSNNQ